MNKKKIIIANWKMKLNIKDSLELARYYVEVFSSDNKIEEKEIVVCPSEIVLPQVKEIISQTPIKLGAQNVFWESAGSYTGEVSASTLEEAGCSHVIIGHSERRGHLLENYEMIHQKVKAVLNNTEMTPVICIGETLEDREDNKQDYIIVDQLQHALNGIKLIDGRQVIVAYEPIWAIGTGQVIRPADAENMHEIIIAALVDLFGVDIIKKQFRIIYGGSVDEINAKDFKELSNIDGFLVGGASLLADKFSEVVDSI